MFMPFTMVTYTGNKFRAEIKDKLGEVVCRVGGHEGAYVVEFGDHSYILGEDSIRRYTPSAKDREERRELQVTHRRRKPTEDEA